MDDRISIRGAGGVPTPTTAEERRRGFAILFICLMCVGMGQSIMFSNFPPLAREMGLSETQTGVVFLASGLIWVFVAPWWGRRSDVLGRKPVMLIGLVGYALSMASFASVLLAGIRGLLTGAALFFSLMAARSIYGILSAGTFPAAQAYIADRTTMSERTSGVSTLTAAFGLGSTIGPGFGAALAVFGLVTPLYAVAIAGLISAVTILRWLPERTPPAGSHHASKLRLADARIIPHLVVGAALSVAQGIQIYTVGFYFMDTLHLSGHDAVQMVGVALMASSFAALFTQLGVIQRFRLSVAVLLRGGGVITVIGYALLVSVSVYGTMVFAMVLTGIGLSMMRPGNAAAASLAVTHEEQGSVAGLTGAMAAMGFVIGPVISLPLYSRHHEIPFLACLIVSLLTLVYCVLHPSMRADGVGAIVHDPDSALPKT